MRTAGCCLTTQLDKAKKRSTPASSNDDGARPQTLLCVLCEHKGGKLREARTMKFNEKINECARTLSDGKLLAKLAKSNGDVIEQELKYQRACLVVR